MDYEKMSNKELSDELATLEESFDEYKILLEEVCTNMSELSEKYNNIKEILDKRNGK